MILGGSKSATLRQVQRVSIHGSEFYDLVYQHDEEPNQLRQARIGREQMYTDPQPGDAVTISYTLNMPTAINKRDA